MLSSIHPLGERAKGNSYWLTAVAHIAGAIAGGVALGAAAGILGLALRPLPATTRAVLAGIGCALLAVAAISGRSLPTWRRQVNEDWLTAFRGWVYGAGFGAQLGAGVLTIVTSPVVYAVVLLAVLAPSFVLSVVIGGVFGLVRGGSLLTASAVRDPDSLIRFHVRMQGLAAPVDRAARGGLVLAAMALVVVGAFA